jgi:hypothetical protein
VSASPSSRSSCISSRRQIRRGERSGEEKHEKGLKKPQTLVSTLVIEKAASRDGCAPSRACLGNLDRREGGRGEGRKEEREGGRREVS